MVLLPIRGVFPRTILAKQAIADVAAADAPDVFLALHRNQQLTKIDARFSVQCLSHVAIRG